MTQRLWHTLRGEPAGLVRLSETGKKNRHLAAAWASHYADRGLLLLTLVWLGVRAWNWLRIQMRPEEVYQQRLALGELVFPTVPPSWLWYALLATAVASTLVCFVRPRVIAARAALTVSVLLLLLPELGFGHVEHVNHLFLLAHVYSTFRPLGAPRSAGDAEIKGRGYAWFLLGLLAVYTASGVWKVVDMTIRDVLKPGVTWLEPEAMLATSIAAMRSVDLPMIIPQFVESVAWVFPVGYVLVTVIFCASFVAAFRRQLLIIVLPTIVVFHVLNAVVMYVLFVPTIFMAIVLLLPYDYIFPSIKQRLDPSVGTSMSGTGAAARYERRYAGGDVDEFNGFFAYRERLNDRSRLLASPLYYPGIGWVVTRLLRKRSGSPLEAG